MGSDAESADDKRRKIDRHPSFTKAKCLDWGWVPERMNLEGLSRFFRIHAPDDDRESSLGLFIRPGIFRLLRVHGWILLVLDTETPLPAGTRRLTFSRGD